MMKNVAKWFVLAALVAMVVAPTWAAQEKAKKGQKKQGAQNPAIKALTDQLKQLDLTDEQAAKVKELTAAATQKLAALAKERIAIIGEEGAKKMAAARKEAAAAGKKGKELQEAVNAAVNLSAEQAAKLKEIQASTQATVTELKKAVAGVLTPEQRAKAGLDAVKGAKGEKKRKKDAA